MLLRDGTDREREKGRLYGAETDAADGRAFLERGREDGEGAAEVRGERGGIVLPRARADEVVTTLNTYIPDRAADGPAHGRKVGGNTQPAAVRLAPPLCALTVATA